MPRDLSVNTRLAVRALGIWLVMMAAETVHGIVRTVALAPLVGDLRARQIGVLTGSVLIVGVTWLVARWFAPAGTAALALIGCAWVAMTLAFEIGLGRFVLGASWDRILSDYDPGRGGLMPLGLLVMAWAPLLVSGWSDPDGSARVS